MKLRFGIIAGLFLALFSLYPQMKLWSVRGSEWQGNYAYNDVDEVAYASYLRALMDGRPRKNDPYTGRDDTEADPQPESLFSIQFAAPYTLAIPGRVLGVPTPWMMIIGGAAAAFLTAFIIFWILFSWTDSNWFGLTGSLAVLVGGGAFAGEGAMLEVFFEGFSYPYFPGFRRYVPALAMPAFFALVALLGGLAGRAEPSNSDKKIEPWLAFKFKRSTVLILLALIAFAYTVYSYFYIWTMAAAWMFCLVMCVLVGKPNRYKTVAKRIAMLGTGCILVLLPYFYLLSLRSHSTDDIQLLVHTHQVDLFRFPEYIAIVAVIILVVGFLTRHVEIRSYESLIVLSLAFSVIAVFNQQVLTGRSLQPIHYQVFIGNYVAGLALIGSISLAVRGRPFMNKGASKLLFAGFAALVIAWGFIECYFTVRVLDGVNALRDEQIPVARRLSELARSDPDPHRSIVYHLGIGEGDDLPTIAPQATLWSRHQHVFAGLSDQENKERYYQYLYYQGISEHDLADGMKNGDFISIIALFGWGRHTDRLNSKYKPLTYAEIDDAAKLYGQFVESFDPHRSPESVISYVVIPPGPRPDLTNLDRWYDRDSGERFGRFTLFRVKLRSDHLMMQKGRLEGGQSLYN